MNSNGHRVYFGDASKGYALQQIVFCGASNDHSYSAEYFAERSEHVTLAGDSIIHWNRAERIVSFATGAPSIDCVRLGFTEVQS